MRVQISCKRCGLNRTIAGRGTCVCGAVHIYRPSPRVRRIEIKGLTFQWFTDDRGPDTVMVDDSETITQERGLWVKVQADWLDFPKVDRRKTARPSTAWGIR